VARNVRRQPQLKMIPAMWEICQNSGLCGGLGSASPAVRQTKKFVYIFNLIGQIINLEKIIHFERGEQ